MKEGVGTGCKNDPYEGRDPTPPASPNPFEKKFGFDDDEDDDFGNFADFFTGATHDPRDPSAYPGPSSSSSGASGQFRSGPAEFFASYE